jgi:hypothetical protein
MAAEARLPIPAKKNGFSAKYHRYFSEFEWALVCGSALGLRRSCFRGPVIAGLLAAVGSWGVKNPQMGAGA